jgi:hypothetical protein
MLENAAQVHHPSRPQRKAKTSRIARLLMPQRERDRDVKKG